MKLFNYISLDTGLIVLALTVGSLVPFFGANNYILAMLIMVGVYAIALMGLDFVVGYVGEVSVGHAALVGVGAYTAGTMSLHLGLPMHITIPAAIAVGAFFGWLLSLPALKVQGPYLTLMTLAFGYAVSITLGEAQGLTMGQEGLRMHMPVYFGTELNIGHMYALMLVFLALSTFAVNRIVKSSIGRAFEALRDSPDATDCMGVGVAKHKIMAFTLSGAFAGLGGALFAYSQNIIVPGSFSFEVSLTLLLGMFLGGKRSRMGALLGAGFVVWLPQWLSSLQTFQFISFGTLVLVLAAAIRSHLVNKSAFKMTAQKFAIPLCVLAAFAVLSLVLHEMTEFRLAIYGSIVLLSVYYIPDGLMGLFARHVGGQKRPALSVPALVTPPSNGEVVRLEHVTHSFNGADNVLTDVSFTLSGGEILGLIGPNGAGKSTTMNVLTAVYTPTSGNVFFLGNNTQRESKVTLARKGLTRTFQNLEVFGNMSVLDNVLVGLHRMTGSNPLPALLGLHGKRNQAALARAYALLDLVNLTAYAQELAKNMSYGQQRSLEIARALATDPSVILLDEPAAGLRGEDLEALKVTVSRIKDAGIAVVLIEHHMDVVMSLCDRIVVLDNGHQIAQGTPDDIQNDKTVQAAYLGSEDDTH